MVKHGLYIYFVNKKKKEKDLQVLEGCLDWLYAGINEGP